MAWVRVTFFTTVWAGGFGWVKEGCRAIGFRVVIISISIVVSGIGVFVITGIWVGSVFSFSLTSFADFVSEDDGNDENSPSATTSSRGRWATISPRVSPVWRLVS